VFAPVEKDKLLLVDGGLVNPVPIAPTLNDSSAMTIVVDLNGRAELLESAEKTEETVDKSEVTTSLRKKISKFIDDLKPKSDASDTNPPGAIDLALRSLDTMQNTIARMKLSAYSPRVTVEIPRNLCTLLEFYRAREIIDFGYRRTEESLQKAGL